MTTTLTFPRLGTTACGPSSTRVLCIWASASYSVRARRIAIRSAGGRGRRTRRQEARMHGPFVQVPLATQTSQKSPPIQTLAPASLILSQLAGPLPNTDQQISSTAAFPPGPPRRRTPCIVSCGLVNHYHSSGSRAQGGEEAAWTAPDSRLSLSTSFYHETTNHESARTATDHTSTLANHSPPRDHSQNFFCPLGRARAITGQSQRRPSDGCPLQPSWYPWYVYTISILMVLKGPRVAHCCITDYRVF